MHLSINILIVAATVLVSWLAFNRPRLLDRLILWPPAIERQRQYDRLLTHGFIHADWMHLAFNMITLWSFGGVVEATFAANGIGTAGFLGFYLSAIVVAILPSYLRHLHDARYRSLGASGGVAAVLFASILFNPWSKLIIFPIPLPVPAILFAVLYVGYSIWMDRRGGDNINHSAHLVGGAYGIAFTLLAVPGSLGHFLRQLGVQA
jgi:membrane associated rhomboid family serine protease